jgi:hypothetical protein
MVKDGQRQWKFPRSYVSVRQRFIQGIALCGAVQRCSIRHTSQTWRNVCKVSSVHHFWYFLRNVNEAERVRLWALWRCTFLMCSYKANWFRNICLSKNFMLMYWYLCRQFAIDTVNNDSQKLVQFLSVNVCDSSPKYFRCLRYAIKQPRTKLMQTKLHVRSWMTRLGTSGGLLLPSATLSCVWAVEWMGWVSKIKEQAVSGNR